MPAVLTYPGVYIEEVPSGVRTISGVATSIAAFVGRTRRGPVNEPVTINSYADFERQFGGLWLGSPLSFAVRDFFVNGGGQAIVVRLFHPTFADSAAQQVALTAAKGKAKTGADAVDAAAAGAVSGATTAQDVVDAAETTANGLTDPIEKRAGQIVAAAAATKASSSNKQDPADEAHDAVAGAIDTAGDEAAPVTHARLDAGGFALEAAAPGSWGNALRARIDHDIVPANPAAFNLTLRDAQTGATETFRNLSITPGDPRQADQVLKASSDLVRMSGSLPAARPTASAAPPTGKGPFDDPSSYYKVADVASDGLVLVKADFTDGQAKKEGLHALDKADIFNLLCIPPHQLQGSLNQQTGSIEDTLIDEAAQYCAQRRAMLIIDPPAKWDDKEAVLAGIDSEVGPSTKNAAVYFPSILRPNPLRGDREEPFAPCGAVAGVIARTDTQRGIWKAPAGLDATLFGVPRLSVPLTDAENGELNIRGVNCLRSMPGAGRVVWGARTRRGDDRLGDEWKYVPVRRTALYIEESLYRGTQWVVFEPNDEPLWASIRLNVGAFMNGLFRQGAFQGGSPRDAYFVRCDKDTTTQADIDKGVVNILVGFAPLKPAEFVVIRIQQMAGQIQT